MKSQSQLAPAEDRSETKKTVDNSTVMYNPSRGGAASADANATDSAASTAASDASSSEQGPAEDPRPRVEHSDIRELAPLLSDVPTQVGLPAQRPVDNEKDKPSATSQSGLPNPRVPAAPLGAGTHLGLAPAQQPARQAESSGSPHIRKHPSKLTQLGLAPARPPATEHVAKATQEEPVAVIRAARPSSAATRWTGLAASLFQWGLLARARRLASPLRAALIRWQFNAISMFKAPLRKVQLLNAKLQPAAEPELMEDVPPKASTRERTASPSAPSAGLLSKPPAVTTQMGVPAIWPVRADQPAPQPGPGTAGDDRRGWAANDQDDEPLTPAARRRAVLSDYLNIGVVGAYKVAGFSLLSVILLGLFAYVALNGLFFLHQGWAAPTIISPSDPRVVEVRARLAHEIYNRQKVNAELARVGADLDHARRTVTMEQQYQDTFQKALSKSASNQMEQLEAFKKLQNRLANIRFKLAKASADYASTQGAAAKSAFDAKLIDREQKATRDFRLAELEGKNVQLQQQAADLKSRIFAMGEQALALDSVAAAPPTSAPATVEAMQLKRSFVTSILEYQKAQGEVKALRSAKHSLEEALVGYDGVISMLQDSPLLLASSGELNLAFVPYDNLDSVVAGEPVYGCALQVVWCSRVGTVGEAVEGEVEAKHPVYGSDLRGRLVRLELTDPEWAKESVLHVGRPPLLF